MPRSARLDARGAVHHVIIRGIERRKIFRDSRDRNNFLERVGKLVPETNTACYAWALMSNHAHFLFRTGDVGLSTLMRRLLTGYVVSFNRRHKRHGQLFQNRYKSIICQEDIYLKELVRYIHLNPLRAKVVSDISDLNKYDYSGHSVLTGNKKCEWQDTDYVLSYFGKRVGASRKRYIAYVEEGIKQGRRPELVGGGLIRSLGGWAEVKKMWLRGQDRIKGDERILGESDFVMDVLSQADEKYSRQYELKRLGYDLERLEWKVTEIYGIDKEELHLSGRQKIRSEARSLLFYWAVRELGISGTSLAKRFKMSQSGVVYAVNKGERMAKERNYQLLK
jgi:REP element-mobilizing transposase RayT